VSLYALGLNHATAPLAVREMIAFQTDTLVAALRDVVGSLKVNDFYSDNFDHGPLGNGRDIPR
jgi:glutamyl-tRNA reductase